MKVERKRENGTSLILRNALILCLITFIAGIALAFVYALTHPISRAEYQAEQDACRAVFAEADAFALSDDIALPTDEGFCVEKLYLAQKAEKTIGYVMRVCTDAGYGGDIVLVLGVKPDGKITGMRVIDASGESPGLGARCLDSDFSDQFAGKQTPLTYAKGGLSAGSNAVDAISGATVTTSAVTGAVDRALIWMTSYLPALPLETDVNSEKEITSDTLTEENSQSDEDTALNKTEEVTIKDEDTEE